MKKLMFAAIVALTFFGAIPAQAASHGSTLVPAIDIYYRTSSDYIATNIILTNITGEEVTCTIKLFDYEGVNITSDSIAGIYTGSHDLPEVSSLGTNSTFTIPAKGSRWVGVLKKSPCRVAAHAIIEWSSENDAISQALAGGLRIVNNTSNGKHVVGSMLINNGQPF